MTDWSSLTIAVVAGDEREAEIARLAAETGAEVRAFGFPGIEQVIDGVTASASAAEAMRGADYCLFPIPGIADTALFAPAAPAPIVPDEALLSELAPGAVIFLGAADDHVRAAAESTGVWLSEYESDEELMLQRAPAVVEGAIQRAVEVTDVTIHATNVAVVGYGNIGALLALRLLALGARTHVAARNPIQRADAHARGATALSLEELVQAARTLEMVFSTVPARVVDREILERLPRRALVMDLAAPPGSVDLALAEELGHRAVWARGLGRHAPVTVGRSQWEGIRRRIEEHRA
jgi:dipicolinate synthase subunit A